MARPALLSRRVALLGVPLFAIACARPAAAALRDGFYPVVPEGRPGARAIVFDPRTLDPEEDGPVERLAIDPRDFVPLALARPPRTTVVPDGRVGLDVALDKARTADLAAFTERHLGERVVIVAGGEAVSAHAVKAVVRGGVMQISRCSPRGCARLLTRLEK